VEDWKDMDDVREYARSGELGTEFDWCWLDSISLFQDFGVDDIFEQEVARFPHRKQYGKDKGEYGRNMDRLSEWFRDMIKLDQFNFGYTAHPAYTEIGDSNKLGPYVQGKNMTLKIMGYTNMVGYLDVVHRKDGDRRVLRTRSTDEYLAKDQFDAFPKGRLVDPTMPKFMAAVDEARAKRRTRSSTTTKTTTRRRVKTRRREQ
jgi:hypothetical protein